MEFYPNGRSGGERPSPGPNSPQSPLNSLSDFAAKCLIREEFMFFVKIRPSFPEAVGDGPGDPYPKIFATPASPYAMRVLEQRNSFGFAVKDLGVVCWRPSPAESCPFIGALAGRSSLGLCGPLGWEKGLCADALGCAFGAQAAPLGGQCTSTEMVRGKTSCRLRTLKLSDPSLTVAAMLLSSTSSGRRKLRKNSP